MNQKVWEQTVEWVGIVAGCLIKEDDKFLLVRENQPRVYGLWNLPAGYVDKGETIEAAAIREAKEETGYDVEIIKELGIFHESAKKPVKHAFSAKIIGGELKVQADEILDVKWLTYDEIKKLNEDNKLRASWIWESINL